MKDSIKRRIEELEASRAIIQRPRNYSVDHDPNSDLYVLYLPHENEISMTGTEFEAWKAGLPRGSEVLVLPSDVREMIEEEMPDLLARAYRTMHSSEVCITDEEREKMDEFGRILLDNTTEIK